jgi:hypothetical protein
MTIIAAVDPRASGPSEAGEEGLREAGLVG